MERPWWKFCGRDWLNDLELRKCSLPARGLWIDMLALMNEGIPYGSLATKAGAIEVNELAHTARISTGKCMALLQELEGKQVFSRNDGIIFSRRMVRDETERVRKQSAGRQGGNPALLKQDVKHEDNGVLKHGSDSVSDSFFEANSGKTKKDDPFRIEFDTLIWPHAWRKTAKEYAFKCYVKQRKTVSCEIVVAGVKRDAALYLARDVEHRPHMSTWLNEQRYNDEPDPPASQNKSKLELLMEQI